MFVAPGLLLGALVRKEETMKGTRRQSMTPPQFSGADEKDERALGAEASDAAALADGEGMALEVDDEVADTLAAARVKLQSMFVRCDRGGRSRCRDIAEAAAYLGEAEQRLRAIPDTEPDDDDDDER